MKTHESYIYLCDALVCVYKKARVSQKRQNKKEYIEMCERVFCATLGWSQKKYIDFCLHNTHTHTHRDERTRVEKFLFIFHKKSTLNKLMITRQRQRHSCKQSKSTLC